MFDKLNRYAGTPGTPDGVRRLTVELPDRAPHELAVAAEPPSVTIESVALAENGRAAEVVLRGDTDGEGATSLAWSYSPNDSFRLDTFATRVRAHTSRVELGHLPGGQTARLIVTATRDLRLTEVASAPLAVPDRPPELHVWDEDGPRAVAYEFALIVGETPPTDGCKQPSEDRRPESLQDTPLNPRSIPLSPSLEIS